MVIVSGSSSSINSVKIVVDGLNHPIAGGSFIDLCQKGEFDNTSIEDDTFEYLGQSSKRVIFNNTPYEDPLTGETRRIPLEVASFSSSSLSLSLTSLLISS